MANGGLTKLVFFFKFDKIWLRNFRYGLKKIENPYTLAYSFEILIDKQRFAAALFEEQSLPNPLPSADLI